MRPGLHLNMVVADLYNYLTHCFPYFAQALFCTDDDAIELPGVEPDSAGEAKSL